MGDILQLLKGVHLRDGANAEVWTRRSCHQNTEVYIRIVWNPAILPSYLDQGGEKTIEFDYAIENHDVTQY